MALYLGSEKQNINLNGVAYDVNLFTAFFAIEDTVLTSTDDYIFKDANGLYLTPKEDE